MSIDIEVIDRKMKRIEEQEQRIKKEKLELQKKKKAAKEYAFQKMGEIFFESFKVVKGLDTSSSKASLLTLITSSKLNDKEKKRLSDLVKSGVLNFERSSTGEEKITATQEHQRHDSFMR